MLLDRFLLLRPRWLPTLLFIPLLYGVGWVIAVPLMLVGLPENQVSLTGTLLSFGLFVLTMPRWAALRWSTQSAWCALGIQNPSSSHQPRWWTELLKGLLVAIGLLSLISVATIVGQWGQWIGAISPKNLINSLLLGFGVGFAEEIIFRGWLWNELNHALNPRDGALIQAIIFSLVHTRFNIGLSSTLGLLIGLFLLGIVLALMRHRYNGSLWASIGLHGGLVSIWFLIDNGLVNISTQTPTWLIGPGGDSPNPIGGIAGCTLLTAILIAGAFQRKAIR